MAALPPTSRSISAVELLEQPGREQGREQEHELELVLTEHGLLVLGQGEGERQPLEEEGLLSCS